MLDPIPVASCSKAPRGLSVLPRVTCIFTGTSVSPSAWPRQRPTRYAIRAGRNLPDKEFRSTLTWRLPAWRRLFHCLPACRHADGTISSPGVSDVRRMASEDSGHLDRSFLLIVRTLHVVTAPTFGTSSEGFSDVPAYSQILLRQRFHLRTVHVVTPPPLRWGWVGYQLSWSPMRSDYLIPSEFLKSSAYSL